MDEMLSGHSEALARAKAWTGQKMADKNEMCYPEATNNRGVHGRERHAGGESVSGMPSQGGAQRNSSFGQGSSNMPSQGGASSQGRECHAYGDVVGPQSGAMMPQQPQPQPYRRGGGVDREGHGFGSMVSGAFKSAKKAATPYANQAKDYVKGQAKDIASAGKQYAKDQGKHLVKAGRQYASDQLGAASKAAAPPSGEPHSWGSFVRGAKKTLAPIARGAISGAKGAASDMVRNAGRSAMQGSMEARGGGSIDDHQSRKADRRARRSYDD